MNINNKKILNILNEISDNKGPDIRNIGIKLYK